MCCAVQYPQISQKMGLVDDRVSSYVLPRIKSKVKVELKKEAVTARSSVPDSEEEKEPCNTELGVTKKDKMAPVAEPKTKEPKKKKKWKAVPLADLGFNLSLFPRPTRPEKMDPEEEAKIIEQIENELEEYDKTVDRYQDFDTTNTELFEGGCKKMDKFARCDRDRKTRKAGKQVKDKYCTSISNNKGRKKLFIHHRLFKLIQLEEKRMFFHLPSNPAYKSDITSRDNKCSNETKSRLKPFSAIPPAGRPAPVQNLRYALQQSNAATDLDSALVNVLINIQHRELTPEDYELLLRLDETVAPKTIDKSTLDNFKTDTVDETSVGEMCPVCMDAYVIGENRKFLPCNHVFHAKCIVMWLENSSRNCPIDGLPVDEAL